MKGIIVFVVVFCSLTAFGHKTDSIGTRVKNKTTYILHKIEKGDGLYSLSKKYGVSLSDIIKDNPGTDKVVKIDQIIWIPTSIKPEMNDKLVTDYFTKDGNITNKIEDNDDSKSTVSTFAKYHKVEAGQTLYAISKLYNTSVEMIKTLNGLESNVLSEGQRILVQDGKAVDKEVEKEDVVETDYKKMKEQMEDNKYSDVGFDTEVETKLTENSSGYTVKIEKLVEYNIEKIEEKGTASIGSDKVPNDKNFAVHFNAPIGTVIMVTNPSNKSTVFVKVVGNFKRKNNSSEIIKLSKLSAEQIGLETKKSVSLSYAR